MSSASRREFARLLRELESEESRQLLRELQKKAPFLERFSSWPEVLEYMQGPGLPDADGDEVLRPLFEVRSQAGDPLRSAVVLAILWTHLESIHHRKRHWHDDPEEFWQAIVCTFLKAVSCLDLAKRADRLVCKLCNDTIYRLYRERRHSWKREETAVDPRVLDLSMARKTESSFAQLVHEEREARLERLRRHFLSGHITESDLHLLIATRVYGEPLSEYARRRRADYETLKKRRLRIETGMRKAEKRREHLQK